MQIQNAAARLSLLLVIGSSALYAQPKKPSPIVLESPELYDAFFRAHSGVDQQIQASSSLAASKVSSDTAAIYSISADDLPKLTAEVRKYQIALGEWLGREGAYVNQQRLAKKLPDIKVLISYQRQKQRLVMNAHGSIHAALKPASWTGLQTYVNGRFKTSLSTKNGAGK